VLITHELNENPFAAAFMDWRAELRLSRVTVTRSTLVEWRCSFRTTAHVRAAPRGSHRALRPARCFARVQEPEHQAVVVAGSGRAAARPDVLSGTRTAGPAAS